MFKKEVITRHEIFKTWHFPSLLYGNRRSLIALLVLNHYKLPLLLIVWRRWFCSLLLFVCTRSKRFSSSHKKLLSFLRNFKTFFLSTPFVLICLIKFGFKKEIWGFHVGKSYKNWCFGGTLIIYMVITN